MSWFTSWMNPGRGYDAAQEQYDKYYGQAQGALNPYAQQGQQQYGNMNNYIQNLMNPQGLQDQWAKGYKESESAKNMENMAQEHGLNAASGMGLMGSNTALNAIQSGTSQIGAQDRQNYLNDLMEKYKMGAGLSQGVYNTGAGAAQGMSQNAMNMGQNSANMQYNRTNAPGAMFGQTAGAASKLIMDYLTGGMGTGGMGRGAWSTGGG
jgi:hypothetical protein